MNGTTWAHVLAAVATVLDIPRTALLTADELAALAGAASPEGIIIRR